MDKPSNPVQDLRKKIRALHLEVPESIANSIKESAEEVINQLAMAEELRGDLNRRLLQGRHYLMGVEPKDLTVEDALVALGYTADGLNQ